MAKNLQLLKRRINTSKNIAQIGKAMEMISASKIKRAQNQVVNNKPYAERITELTQTMLLQPDLKNFSHPLLETNDSEKKLYIIISPDRGLCGSLNTNLFKKIIELDNKNIKMVTLGRRAERFCLRLEGELTASFPMGTSLPQYAIVYDLIEIIEQEFVSKKVSEVSLVYSQFNSIFSQSPVVKKILPIERPAVEIEELPYVFEPKVNELLKDLLPFYLEVSLFTSVLEAYTSEQAARMVAMQNAKNNALDIADALTLEYNKSRQERITGEILDIANNSAI